MCLQKQEARNAFLNGVGCFFTCLSGLVSTLVIVFLIVIPVFRNGHVESSVTCPSGIGDVRYDLILVQDGLEWRKEITSRSVIDIGLEKTLVQTVHDPQIGVFLDVTAILWCAQHGGVIVRGTLKGASTSALYWINIKKEVLYYGGVIP